MTVYNGERFLKEAIESCLFQTHTNLELIIIDDGSTDCSLNIISSFEDNRIKLLKNKSNKGQSYSRNRGIRESVGSFIAIMDSDDIAYYNRIDKQINYLIERPKISFCCSWADTIDEENQVTGQKRLNFDVDILKLKLLFECPIIHPTVMWRKSDFIENKLWYDEYFEYAQDYDLWSRAIEKLCFGIIEQPLLKFRFHHNKSISHSKKNIQIKYARIISQRNLQKIGKVAPLLSRLNCLIARIILYKMIIQAEYLNNLKDLKISYFRHRLFDGNPLPQRLKDSLRSYLLK